MHGTDVCTAPLITGWLGHKILPGLQGGCLFQGGGALMREYSYCIEGYGDGDQNVAFHSQDGQ